MPINYSNIYKKSTINSLDECLKELKTNIEHLYDSIQNENDFIMNTLLLNYGKDGQNKINNIIHKDMKLSTMLITVLNYYEDEIKRLKSISKD